MNFRDLPKNFKQLGPALKKSEYFKKLKMSGIYKMLRSFLAEYWLLCFFILFIAYLELLYRLWIFRDFSFDYMFAFLFAVSSGAFLYIFISLFPIRTARFLAIAVTFFTCLIYGIQLIYFRIFQTPLSLVSIGGAGDALKFWDIILEAILKNIVAVLLLFVPFVFILANKRSCVFKAKEPIDLSMVLLFCAISFSSAIVCVTLSGDSPSSQYTLYFKAASPELSVNKLGVLTTMRLDFERLAVGLIKNQLDRDLQAKGIPGDKNGEEAGNGKDEAGAGANPAGPGAGMTDAGPGERETPQDGTIAGGNGDDPDLPGGPEESEVPIKPYNVMDIDFDALMADGENDSLYPMHKYFSSVQPTATNRYTGMFKGCNLVMFTAEGFSPYVISPELTPTLYKMANEGFVFKNFYNPVWWVSTSDGEYVACTGLIPKGGVWSFAKSGSNYMPFTMGNQLRKLGYTTKAYHNHTYTYYKRDVSHPNMGYDYKGVGNGLNVKKTWPESDLEMINVTVDEYIDKQPFHAYYMTVSGHMNYNFYGNQMASKNKKYVEHLPYSDPAKAYIACNLELEFALRALMERLEAAGIAENTVIVLSADHYPYGLEKKYLDELAGHEVEKNFELYKSTLIIYKKGMEPVIVEKPCASLDIIPTLSNLFGLEYDSRLLMGTDILSDSPALLIFSNRSWITDRAMYNSVSNKVTFKDGTAGDKEYVKEINRIVAQKFEYSAKILETDYYGKILKGNS